MRNWFVTLVVLMFFISPVFSQNVEQLFKDYAITSTPKIFTYVPRGLIISIDESEFFNKNSDKLKPESFPLLNSIADILNSIPQDCVIEGHTETSDNLVYKSPWELSLARANVITKYFIRCRAVSPERLFTIGFGEFMPFVDNVATNSGLNNRIDFVILNYKLKH